MSIAYKFLKEDKFGDNMEDNINFIIDHYGDAMKTYRLMKLQTNINNQKKADAHKALQELREREELLRSTGQKLSEKEKLELSEKKEFYVKQREEEVFMYCNGEIIEYDQLSHLLLKYQKYMKHVEKIDHWGRGIVGNVAKKTTSISLWPLKKMCGVVARQTDNSKTKNYLFNAEDFISNIPKQIEKHITQEINLDDHLPKQEKMTTE